MEKCKPEDSTEELRLPGVDWAAKPTDRPEETNPAPHVVTVPVAVNMEPAAWPWRLFANGAPERFFPSMGEALDHLYKEKLLPMEVASEFHRFHHFTELPSAYFSARPLVLTIGQYSTGKTSFIRHLTKSDYPGQQIGPEPTTDRFVAVCHGDETATIPGHALVQCKKLPFTPLSKFGGSFLCRLEAARLPSKILEQVTFVDTPGVLSGEKQRQKRGYNFEEVIAWFAEHAAMIILFFDAHKLDISDEFRDCITALKGYNNKVQIILNKADKMTQQQLLRVYGALMWSLGKVVETPEVARVYVGSFWDHEAEEGELRNLFKEERKDLDQQIDRLPGTDAQQKINDLSKRARLCKAHAFVLSHLRDRMPKLWGHQERKDQLIRDLNSTYTEVERSHGVSMGDFPDEDKMRRKLAEFDFTKFERVDKAKMDRLDALLSKDIPKLLELIACRQQ